jgi:predicted HTH domain antitoxin
MEEAILVEYPEYLANSMRMNKRDFGKEVKISAIIKLFELEKISSGIAARVLNLSRVQFLDLLAKYNVPFLNADDLNEDLRNA